jgi:hypothetical protein
MKEIINHFNNNKILFLEFIKKEKHIFPKMFINNIEDFFDENFYEKLCSKENLFSVLFKELNIFNIEHIEDNYFFKSDHKYKILYLFFSNQHNIYVNNKMSNKDIIVYESEDEIFIKNGNFLKICFLDNGSFEFNNLKIKTQEKNLFDENKIKKFLIKDVFFKKF